MNKKVLLGGFSLVAGSLFAAENAVSSFNPYVAVKGGYSILTKKDNLKYKNGFNGAVEFGVSYDAWRLGLEVSYRQNKIKESTNAGFPTTTFNKINALAGMINVYYDYALTEECSLYVGAGLGMAKFNFVRLADKIEDGKAVFAWQVLAGVAYDINENWTVEAGYRLFGTSKVKALNAANAAVKVKTPLQNSLELGLRYNF